MSDLSSLDPERRRLIERLRREWQESQAGHPEPATIPAATLSSAARAVLSDWVTSGDYDRAIASIAAHDPDIATQ